jgi:hypothetical protein
MFLIEFSGFRFSIPAVLNLCQTASR